MTDQLVGGRAKPVSPSATWCTGLRLLLLRLVLVTTMLLTQLMPSLTPPASAGVFDTLGDFLSLGRNTVKELEKAIAQASGEAKEILEEAKAAIEEVLDDLERKFQNNVDYAITSLDAETRSIILYISGLIETISVEVQESVEIISAESQDVIRKAAIEIRTSTAYLEQALQRSILYVGVTGSYLISEATSNAILIISIVMLGVGALVTFWLLYSRRFPRRWLVEACSLPSWVSTSFSSPCYSPRQCGRWR